MGEQAEGLDLAATHIPVLVPMLYGTQGSILEFGAGLFSTPLIYWTCKANNRKFLSFENDKAWADKLKGLTTYIENWDDVPINEEFWSMVFIDHRPAMRRHVDAVRVKDNAQFVILHDSEPEIDKYYAYRRVYPHFKYVYQFTRLKPNTAICSNYFDPRLHIVY